MLLYSADYGATFNKNDEFLQVLVVFLILFVCEVLLELVGLCLHSLRACVGESSAANLALWY